MTPLMTYWFIPLSTRLLEPWLSSRAREKSVSLDQDSPA
jgi:antibiotic biosynthesis monooxygenase (ABM) superfamily enzyme